MPFLPKPEELTIGFAHAAYELGDAYAARRFPGRHFEVRTSEDLRARIAEADVLVVSGLWRNDLLAQAEKLSFIQSISAGVDQFDLAGLSAAGVRLASAQGVNERAVAEHALGLMLSFARQLHLARDHQSAGNWRPMIGDRRRREFELNGKTLAIIGHGRIGARIAALAAAFGMRVVGVRRSPPPDKARGDVVGPDQLKATLADADFVVVSCPLTPETEGLIGPAEFAAMRPGAFLINVARGRVVDEAALLDALISHRVAGAAMDCFRQEPLTAISPFWAIRNVIVTPHSAGETRDYENNVIDLLIENIGRLRDGDGALRNGVI